MRDLGRRSVALIALLTSGTACRGCLVDGITYQGEGGATSASTGDVTTTSGGDATSASTASSGPATTDASAASAGGGTSSTGDGGAGGASSTSSAGGAGTGTGGAPACPRSDDFTTGLNECWLPENAGLAPLGEGGGVVTLAPSMGTSWYGPVEGVSYTQRVTGDFAVSLHVAVDSDLGAYQLGGLLLREPDDAEEDWIESNIGSVAGSPRGVYVNSTFSDGTTLVGNEEEALEERDIGFCRRGRLIFMAWRDEGEDWIVSGVILDPEDDEGFPVPEFGSTIEVGFSASRTDTTPSPVVVATFDDFRLLLGGPVDCVDALEALGP